MTWSLSRNVSGGHAGGLARPAFDSRRVHPDHFLFREARRKEPRALATGCTHPPARQGAEGREAITHDG